MIIINGNETIDYDLENISPHQIKTIEVVHGKSAKEKHGEKGKDGVIYVTTKEIIQTDKDNITISKSFDISHDSDKKPLIFIDGKESTYEEMKKLDKENIESVDVSKGKKSKDKYGSKADNGVVEITTKKK